MNRLKLNNKGFGLVGVLVVLVVVGIVGSVGWYVWDKNNKTDDDLNNVNNSEVAQSKNEEKTAINQKEEKKDLEGQSSISPVVSDKAMIISVSKAVCLKDNDTCKPKINKINDGYADVTAGSNTLVLQKNSEGSWGLGLLGSSEQKACDMGSGYWTKKSLDALCR